MRAFCTRFSTSEDQAEAALPNGIGARPGEGVGGVQRDVLIPLN